MKPAIAIVAFLLFAVSCFGQTSTSDGPGLTVVKKKWHPEFRNPLLDRGSEEETGEPQVDSVRRHEIEQSNDALRAQGIAGRGVSEPRLADVPDKPDPSAAYVYEITARNDGSKEISVVTWEYVFYAANSDQEVGRRRFTSKLSIPPGKTRTLTMHSAIPPTGTVDAAKANSKTPEQYTEKIVIVSVDHSDGSKWTAIPEGQ